MTVENEYSVMCLNCNIIRPLGKHMGFASMRVRNLEDATIYAKHVGYHDLSTGLLLSFLIEHSMHRCRLVTDEDFDFTMDGKYPQTVDGVRAEWEGIDFSTPSEMGEIKA